MNLLQTLQNHLERIHINPGEQTGAKIIIFICAVLLNSIIFFAFPAISYLKDLGKNRNRNTDLSQVKINVINLEEKKKKKKRKVKLKQEKPRKAKTKSTPNRFKLKLGAAGGSGAAVVDKNMKNIVYNEGEVDVDPKRIKGPLPQKPTPAEAAGVAGKVELELIIDENGDVMSVKVFKATEGYGFKEACIQAVWKWKFRPAMVKNIPVRCKIIQPFNFE